jgi:gamma-D-glutamyl-L-lysine dipeptidyl-peptidase
MRRVPTCIALAALALVACGGQTSLGNVSSTASSPMVTATPATPAALVPALGVGPATVAVAVAVVWRHPSSPRTVDAPALANPVRIAAWLDAMSLAQRRALSGRADTQALLGERVRVLAVSGTWARVVVPDQPSPLDRRGYPGWVPSRQLIAGAGPSSGAAVTVVTPTAWLRTTSGARLLKVSYGTQLAALGQSAAHWGVLLPDGRPGRVSASNVVTGTLPATTGSVVAAARQFLGLGYLWAGTSGFGFDCSGVMEIVYRVHGIQIPRDAAAQAVAGVAVRSSALRPGDLVFFARNGLVHHVGMYVGRGMMLHAPHTGDQVKLTSISAAPYAGEYAGARRFLP